MKKAILVFAVMVAVCCLSLFAAEQQNANEPVIKEAPDFWYVCMDFQNMYSNMGRDINLFYAEFKKQGLRRKGANILIRYNSPSEVNTSEVKWAYGIIVDKGTAVKKPLKLVQSLPKKSVIYVHKGPYQGIVQSANMAAGFARQRGYGHTWPQYERYLNNPAKVKPEELRTEIVIPLKKRDAPEQ